MLENLHINVSVDFTEYNLFINKYKISLNAQITINFVD